MAKKTLLSNKRKLISEMDEEMDKSLSQASADWATLTGGDKKIEDLFPVLLELDTVAENSSKIVTITALVSSLVEPKSEKRDEHIDLCLSMGAAVIPQALKDAADKVLKGQALEPGPARAVRPSKRARH